MPPPAAHPALASIVIPSFNYGRFLRQAIDSAVGQTYPNIEVVVVDDGSTDDTAAIATAAGARLVRQPNQGLSAARNAGLDQAHGEFVVFLDADDELLPGAVADGIEALSSNPALACVVRRCQVVDERGSPLPSQLATVDERTDLYREWLQRNFVWTPGAAMFRRRAIVEAGGFAVDAGAAADYAVYLTMARRNGVEFQNTTAVRYRQHGHNMSRDPVLMLTSTLAVFKGERPHVRPDARDAYRNGVAAARAMYGEQIVERLRRSWRAGTDRRWSVGAMLTLLRHCPRTLLAHASRKLGRFARGLPSSPIEPGRFERD